MNFKHKTINIMKIPFVSAFIAFLYGTGTQAVNFNERKDGDLEKIKLEFGKMAAGKRGELSRLNQECIAGQEKFDINSVTETARKGSAEAYVNKIDFSENGLAGTDLSISDLTRHESVHTVMRIINEKFNYQGSKPGLPYTNKKEKSSYRKSVSDFNTNLDNLETELVENLRDGKKLSKKTKAIVDKLYYAKEAIMPRDPRLEALPLGVPSFNIAVHDSLPTFPVMATEKPKRVLTYEGQPALSLTLKHVDKTANALSLISKYRGAFKVVPKENIEVEQPAYMIHYLEPAIEDISKPMMDYMRQRILKCSSSVETPKAEKISGTQTRDGAPVNEL